MNPNDFEHIKADHPRRSWLLLIAFTLLILASGMAIHRHIPDAPRRWNFGALSDTPGESVYSPPPQQPAVVPRQVEPWPAAATNTPPAAAPAPRARTEDRP